jgi:hypothetical protein
MPGDDGFEILDDDTDRSRLGTAWLQGRSISARFIGLFRYLPAKCFAPTYGIPTRLNFVTRWDLALGRLWGRWVLNIVTGWGEVMSRLQGGCHPSLRAIGMVLVGGPCGGVVVNVSADGD